MKPEPAPADPAALAWQAAARRRAAEAFGGHLKWTASASALAAFFFRPERPPLRFTDMEAIAGALNARFAGDAGSFRFDWQDVRVTLNLLGDLADCVFRRFDPDTGLPLDEVPAEVVGPLIGALGQAGPEGERAREALRRITIDWRPVAAAREAALAPAGPGGILEPSSTAGAPGHATRHPDHRQPQRQAGPSF